MAEIRPIMDERVDRVRRGQYELIGTIGTIQTEHGAIRFEYQSGPAIGRLESALDELVFTAAWEGLPDLRTVTNEPCQACLRDCDVCDAAGQKLCEGQGCRENRNCDMCRDTRLMVCPQCRGTKKFATGITGGGTTFKDGKCPECRGLKFQSTGKPQDVKQFVNPGSDLGDITVIGPITALVIDNLPGEAKPQFVFDVQRDLEGDYMHLLLEPTPVVTRAYLIGGALKER